MSVSSVANSVGNQRGVHGYIYTDYLITYCYCSTFSLKAHREVTSLGLSEIGGSLWSPWMDATVLYYGI